MSSSRPTLRVAPSDSNITDRLLEAGWLAAAVLVPLVINLWARQPFEPFKVFVLRMVVWTMMGLWLAEGLLTGRPAWRDLEDNPLLWPALAVLTVLVLATALAVDQGLSLWGSYERGQGLLTQASCVLLFLLVAARLRTPDQVRRLGCAMVATTTLLVGLGLAQALGWDPLGMTTDARSPIYATLGRSNFLGAYLGTLLPLTLALVLTTDRRGVRLATIGLALAQGMIVALTLSRGACLTAAVTLAVFSALWVWSRLPNRARFALVVGGFLTMAGVIGGSLWLGRAAGSTAARMIIWRATLDLIARRPWLGYGPDSLGLVFPSVYPPQLVYYQGRGVGVDRAHNFLLDWTVTTGVLGLLAMLALVIGCVIIGWRAYQRTTDRERRIWLIACLSAMSGSFAGKLVSFDVTATATITTLLMAMTVALARVGRRASQSRSTQKTKALLRWAAAGLMLVGVGAAVIQLNGQPLAADVSAKMSDDYAAAGDWTEATAAAQRATGIWPVEPAFHVSVSWAYLKKAQLDLGNALLWLEKAEAELLIARDLRPADFRIWAALGELYGWWGNRTDPSKLSQAQEVYRKATHLAPNQATLYTAWGMMELEGERFLQAAINFQRAVDLDATDGYALCRLGDARLALGQVEQALTAYTRAVKWVPDLSDAYLGLARCYWQQGKREDAEFALEQVLRFDPYSGTAQAFRQWIGAAP
jgi:O-antigen ligase/Tfp pilus assembly protein PilF